MPPTRRERAAAGGSGILQAPEAFQTGSQNSAAGSSAVQSDMGDPTSHGVSDRIFFKHWLNLVIGKVKKIEGPLEIWLKDSLIHRLRSVVKAARMSVDDIALKISDQVGIVETAKSDAIIPKEMISSQYSQKLLDLFSKGESLLSDFENKNSLLLEKLDFWMLKFEFEDIEQ